MIVLLLSEGTLRDIDDSIRYLLCDFIATDKNYKLLSVFLIKGYLVSN